MLSVEQGEGAWFLIKRQKRCMRGAGGVGMLYLIIINELLDWRARLTSIVIKGLVVSIFFSVSLFWREFREGSDAVPLRPISYDISSLFR